MIKKWKKLSRADQIRTQVLIVSGMVALYAPLYMSSSGKLFETTKMLRRRQDRIEKRTDMKHIDNDLPSIRSVNSRIERVDEEIRKLTTAFEELDSGFMPIDSSEAQQKLKLDISTLADKSGIRLSSLSTRTSGGENLVLDPDTRRPVLDLRASARYGQLLAFLNGLKDLPFYVSVINLNLEIPKPKKGEKTSGDLLSVQLEMTI